MNWQNRYKFLPYLHFLALYFSTILFIIYIGICLWILFYYSLSKPILIYTGIALGLSYYIMIITILGYYIAINNIDILITIPIWLIYLVIPIVNIACIFCTVGIVLLDKKHHVLLMKNLNGSAIRSLIAFMLVLVIMLFLGRFYLFLALAAIFAVRGAKPDVYFYFITSFHLLILTFLCLFDDVGRLIEVKGIAFLFFTLFTVLIIYLGKASLCLKSSSIDFGAQTEKGHS